MPQDLQISTDLFVKPVFVPSVVTWNRLEGRPRRSDFDRSLRAEIRDPLWMLTRQWQFGEFRGEDAGSAVLAKVQVDSTTLNRYSVRQDTAVPYDASAPLEARVEAEPVPFDLRTRIQIGRHWLRLIGRTGDLLAHHDLYLREYGYELPDSPTLRAYLESDTKSHQQFLAVQGRLVDGGRLLAAVDSGLHDTFVEDKLPEPVRDQARRDANALKQWFRSVYFSPNTDERSGWAGDYLEYQFACAAQAHSDAAKQIVLTADQYHHGDLDWYAFDRETDLGVTLGASVEDDIPPSNRHSDNPLSYIPAPVEFSGMPAVRWWEFEDGRIDLGNISAETTDLVTLVLADFALVYSNDWLVIPYDTKIGALLKVNGIVVTDVFGVKTLIQPSSTSIGSGTDRWSIFNMTSDPNEDDSHSEVFMAPTIAKLQEGTPIEKVLLARDEMANMVWGVEQTVPGPGGVGISGYHASLDLARHVGNGSEPAAVTAIEVEADVEYKLGTTVPENWIPFIPVRAPASNREIRLQRGAMPRFSGSQSAIGVEPRGAFLRNNIALDEDLEAYFVHEEEVPRAGVVLTRSFQRARWMDGKVYTWLGRRKRVGRGEASSGLQFDQVKSVEKPPSPT